MYHTLFITFDTYSFLVFSVRRLTNKCRPRTEYFYESSDEEEDREFIDNLIGEREEGVESFTLQRRQELSLDKVLPMTPLDLYISKLRIEKCKLKKSCTICLEEMKKEKVIVFACNVQHYFHVACGENWLRHNSTCPLCREDFSAAIEAANFI